MQENGEGEEYENEPPKEGDKVVLEEDVKVAGVKVAENKIDVKAVVKEGVKVAESKVAAETHLKEAKTIPTKRKEPIEDDDVVIVSTKSTPAKKGGMKLKIPKTEKD